MFYAVLSSLYLATASYKWKQNRIQDTSDVCMMLFASNLGFFCKANLDLLTLPNPIIGLIWFSYLNVSFHLYDRKLCVITSHKDVLVWEGTWSLQHMVEKGLQQRNTGHNMHHYKGAASRGTGSLVSCKLSSKFKYSIYYNNAWGSNP